MSKRTKPKRNEPKGTIGRDELLKRYNAWLHMERRLLALEMFPEMGKDAERWIPEDRAVNLFHFPDTGWENAPKPSTRAARVLEAAGVSLEPDTPD